MSGRLPSLFWYCLALLSGVLVAASRPALAAGRSDAGGHRAFVSVLHHRAPDGTEPRAEFAAVPPLLVTSHGAWCPVHLTAAALQPPRSLSWCRGTARRHQRGHSDHASSAYSVGIIPAPEPLIAQRCAWPCSVMLPPSVTGRHSAPPRAPPALN